MVYCVAFNCKTGSGQGVGLFKFPKDEKWRKVWIFRAKRKDFRPSKTSRLCAKHFTNDKFVVDPSLAIGYKLKKLQLKPDAIPSIFDFNSKKQGYENADSLKRKQRQSGAVAKRKRIEVVKAHKGEKVVSLESFHRVISFFAPKSLHFFHAQMEARLYLAALHFNENVNRGQAVTLDGSHQYRVSFRKGRKGEGVAKEIKTRQTYRYIDDLFDELLIRREMYTSYSEAFDARQREDKIRPAPLAQSLPRQSKNEIVDRHISRFNLD